MLSELRSMSPSARLLVVNQTGINMGFYMVFPFLASYLLNDMAMAAATVGLVLGARTLSQQGLFLPSGVLVDRYGPWYPLVIGCGLRVVAFITLGLAQSLTVVIASVLLIGVAGALFNPAARVYLALESTTRRAKNFAVFEVFGNVGALAGPLLGAVLVTIDFQTSALVAAAVFAALTTAQLAILPKSARSDGLAASPWAGIRRIITDRKFVLSTVAMSSYLALFNQLYLALPLEAERVTGYAGATGAIFLVFAVLGIAFQVRVAAWCARRWSAQQAVGHGIATMGASFVPLLLSTALVPTFTAQQGMLKTVAFAALLLVTTIIFSLGGLMVTPHVVVVLSERVGDRLMGTAYGWYYLMAAIATMVVAWAVGALIEIPEIGRSLSCALLVAVGAAGAAGVASFHHDGATREIISRPVS